MAKSEVCADAIDPDRSENHADGAGEMDESREPDRREPAGEESELPGEGSAARGADRREALEKGQRYGGEGREDGGEEGIEEEKKGEVVLPEDIAKSVEVVHHVSGETGFESTVYLVGTAHISKESCDLVEKVIEFVKPEAVFIELCGERRSLLTRKSFEVPTLKQMLQSWRSREMNAFGIVHAYILAECARRMEAIPGGEFRRAYDVARACDALVVLGDRPVSITLKRAVGKLTLWQKIKIACYALWGMICFPAAEELNKMLAELTDMDELAELLKAYCKDYPSILNALLTERDLFMTSTLRSTCSKFSSVVAVVGKGHVSGIISNWTNPPIDIDPLLEVPQKKSWGRWKLYFVVGVGVGVYLGKRWISS